MRCLLNNSLIEPEESVLELVKTKVARLSTHLQHPGNFAHVPNSSVMVGVVADALLFPST